MSSVNRVESQSEATGASSHSDLRAILAMRSRSPGYAVAQKCLEVQAAAEAVDPSLRTPTSLTLAPDAWSWYVGAQGERHVGALLETLGPEWSVLHSVPIGAGTKDVDHLLVGPAGVFAINTKHHRGSRIWVGDYVLRVNNSNTPHLKAARSDAQDAARRLTKAAGYRVEVTSVIAIVGESSISDARRGSRLDPVVVSSRELVEWLRQRNRRISDAEVHHLRLVTEEPQTWHVDPAAANTLRVMQRFDRLEAEVGRPSQKSNVRRSSQVGPSGPTRGHRTASTRPPGRSGARRSRGPSIPRLLLLLLGVVTMPIWLPLFIQLLQAVMVGAITSVVQP